MTTWLILAGVNIIIRPIPRPAFLDSGLRRNDGRGRINALKDPK